MPRHLLHRQAAETEALTQSLKAVEAQRADAEQRSVTLSTELTQARSEVTQVAAELQVPSAIAAVCLTTEPDDVMHQAPPSAEQADSASAAAVQELQAQVARVSGELEAATAQLTKAKRSWEVPNPGQLYPSVSTRICLCLLAC